MPIPTNIGIAAAIRVVPHKNDSELSAPAKSCQLHIRLNEKDYLFLRSLAGQEDESMARIVRRLIRRLRLEAEKSCS